MKIPTGSTSFIDTDYQIDTSHDYFVLFILFIIAWLFILKI